MGERRGRRGILLDLEPLRVSPAYRWLWLGTSLSAIGSQMTVVAIGIHIFALTGSTQAVALVGIVSLVPMMAVGLWGGSLADRFDRRTVALLAASVAWGSVAALALCTWLHIEATWPYYLLATLNACAATVVSSTRLAIYPRLLPAELLPAAAALTGAAMGLMVTVGPMLAGVLIATVGIPWTFTLDAVLFISAFLGIWSLPRLVPEGAVRQSALAAVLEGFRFLGRAPNVRMSFLVDIVAMTLGNPRVLFPALGAVLLGGGAVTVGILTAAGAIGATVCSLFSGRLGGVRRQGLAIERSIIAYGVVMAGFGVTLLIASGAPSDEARWPLILAAAVFLALSGAADQISAIFRMTLLQSAVPDAMRGRMQGVFTVVVTGGPRVGDLYVGLAVGVAALWFPPLAGGIAIVAIIAVLVRVGAGRGFRRYDALHPTP